MSETVSSLISVKGSGATHPLQEKSHQSSHSKSKAHRNNEHWSHCYGVPDPKWQLRPTSGVAHPPPQRSSALSPPAEQCKAHGNYGKSENELRDRCGFFRHESTLRLE